MTFFQVNWSAEHSQFLADNMVSGGSYAEIAKTMNEKFSTSYTRNALIGRAARMGLVSTHKQKYVRKPSARKPRAPKPAPGRPAAPAYEPVETVEMRCAEIVPRSVSILDLEPADCRYPYGESPQITFCGHPKMAGFSYCPGHFHLTRRQWHPRQREAA